MKKSTMTCEHNTDDTDCALCSMRASADRAAQAAIEWEAEDTRQITVPDRQTRRRKPSMVVQEVELIKLRKILAAVQFAIAVNSDRIPLDIRDELRQAMEGE